MKLTDARILIVDDHQELCQMVRQICIQEGFCRIESALSCSQAEQILRQHPVDFLILDVNMPFEDGFSFFQRMKSFLDSRGIPVLFLSARDQDKDRLLGLGLGADDYLTKPFLPKELILRLKAILRRTYGSEESRPPVCFIGRRQADLAAGVVRLPDGSSISLANKEFQLLKLFLENPGRILTFDQLSEAVWGENYFGYENTLTVHIRKLREKIEETPSEPEHLITIKGLGYRMDL